jgi:inosine-uridine nucleoside N-ribohydrolase
MNRKNFLILICSASIFLLSAGCNTSTETDVEPLSLISDQANSSRNPSDPQIEAEEATTPSEKALLIYDDDGSRDGMAALLYLLSIPETSIGAVNISYGEAHPEQYIQLIGNALESIGVLDIPLGAGQDAPLAGGTPFPDWLRQLGESFWDYQLIKTNKVYPYQNAPELMVSIINNETKPVTIFLSGTFTNLAQALRIDPAIKEKIASVYFMGGAVYGPGNITNLIPDSSNKVAEWNIIADPQAAKEVFAAGLNMYMIPLDATNQVIHTKEETLSWHEGDKKAIFVADLYDIMFDDYGLATVEIFDQTAAVIMVQPDLCSFEFLSLDVITDDGDTLGQTIIEPNGEPNINVCLEPDVFGIKKHLDAIYSGTLEPQETPSIDPIAGTWSGSAWNNDFELQVTILVEETCQLGEVCGRFDIPIASCSGTLTWVGMDEEQYQFQAGDKTSGCGEGIDYLIPQKDGTVKYISRGDYGETEGILQREP